ncbi:MAG: hypothetical protein HYW02_02165 [Deltaproteobacteria bacterium]|nr:hypothetical protein [Deltaproteobacteria bacterium]
MFPRPQVQQGRRTPLQEAARPRLNLPIQRGPCSDRSNIREFLIDRSVAGKLVAIIDEGESHIVCVSDNDGRIWRKTLGDNILQMTMHRGDRGMPSHFYASGEDGKFYKSTDGALTWDLIYTFSEGFARAIAIDRSKFRRGTMLVAPQVNEGESGIYVSDTRWRRLSFNFYPFGIEHPTWIVWAVAQNLSGHFFLGVELGAKSLLEGAPYHPPILRSRDGGRTWETLLEENNKHITDIEIDPVNNTIYADDEGPRLWKSTDNGDTWEQIQDQLFCHTLALNPQNPSQMFCGELMPPNCVDNPACGMRGRVWQSTNGGETFEVLLEENLNVVTLHYSPSNETLYIPTYGQGLHRLVVPGNLSE